MAMDLELERRTWAARYATIDAGKLTWDYFHRGVGHELKSDQTVVTIADRDAEQLLRDRLQTAFPGDGFLGEEFGEEPSSTGFRWIIDPIDATANFVRGVPVFATLVGLEREGRMVAGFVYFPGLGRFYWAAEGHGAYRDNNRIQVSRIAELKEAHMTHSNLKFFITCDRLDGLIRLESRVARGRGFGDFWGYLLVAEGTVDLCVEAALSPWDIAALKPIVEQAGGRFTDIDGKDTIFGTGAIATNGLLHDAVLATLAKE